MNKVQIIKFDSQHFFINQSFVHPRNQWTGLKRNRADVDQLDNTDVEDVKKEKRREIHNKDERGENTDSYGKYILQVLKYTHGFDINKMGVDNDPIEQLSEIVMNNRVNIQCADPSLMSFQQNGKHLHYCAIQNSTDEKDSFNFQKLDLTTNSITRGQDYSVDAVYDEQNTRYYPVSVLYGQTNKLFKAKTYFNKTATEETLSNQLVAIIYKLNDGNEKRNELILSIRTIKQFEVELFSLPITILGNFQIYRPQIITRTYINQQNKQLKCEEDLVIITYYDSDKRIEYNKILKITGWCKEKEKFTVASPKRESSRTLVNNQQRRTSNNKAGRTSPNKSEQRGKKGYLEAEDFTNEYDDTLPSVKIEDTDYPLNLHEIIEDEEMEQNPQNERIKTIVTLISKQQISQMRNSCYCKCTADYSNNEYFQMHVNPYIKQNIDILLHDCVCTDKHYYHDEHEEESKVFIFVDYIIQKIIILYNKVFPPAVKRNRYLKRNWLLFELNIMSDRMRYDEILQNHFKIDTDTIIRFDDDAPINRLFENYNLADCKTLTLSYEFKNLIRDQDNIYIFMDQKDASKGKSKIHSQVKRISDPFQYFTELTGTVTMVSDGLDRVCRKNGVLPVNESGDKITSTFIYQSKEFKEQKMYQIKGNKFKHVHLDKKEPEHEILPEFLDTPFILKDFDKIQPSIHKQEFSYKYIGESIIFKEDDRAERPMIVIQLKDKEVNNIWFTLIDFKENNMVNAQLVNLSNFCRQKIKSIQDVKLCPSNSIDYLKNERALTKNQTTFYQNYQLCIFFKELNRFKFLEYEVQWTRSGGLQRSESMFSGKHYNIDLNLVGMKEFIGLNQRVEQASEKESVMTEQQQEPGIAVPNRRRDISFHLMPILDDNFRIHGTQLYISIDQEDKKIFPIPNNKDKDYMCQNRLTQSGYQLFNVGFDNEYILFDVKLSSDVLVQIRFFGEYEKEQLLSTQLRTLMNMVPYDFLQQLQKRTVPDKGDLQGFDWFQCQEVLDGQCINEFQLEEPQIIQNYLEIEKSRSNQSQNDSLIKKCDDPTNYAYISLLDYLLQNDVNQIRFDYFNNTKLKRLRNEVSNDFFQMSIIEKCMQPGQEKLNVTGDIIMNHMFAQYEYGDNPRYQIILMKMVSQVTNVGQGSQFLRFINDEPEKDYYHTTACDEDEVLHIRDKLHDKNLPFFSEEQLQIQTMSLSHIPLLNLNDLICTKINAETQSQGNNKSKQNKNAASTQYKIKYYTVDFRNHILQKRLKQFRDKSFNELQSQKVNHEIYTQKDLSDDIQLFLEKSQGEIENQQVIRHMIDYQFILTKNFYMFILSFYMLTCYIPLVIQIFSNDSRVIFYCNLLMPIGTIPMMMNESIQMREARFSYFMDMWNMNDFTMIIGCWVYSLLSIFNESLQNNFLVIKGSEFIDNHLEDEVIIDLLENIDNSTYRQNHAQDVADQNVRDDWLDDTGSDVYFMSLFNVCLLILGTIKLLFYLRIFENFSKMISLVGFCLYAMIPFMIFFISSIFVFSILFRVCGMEIFLDDYVGFNIQTAYMIYAYRNSIGDLNAPVYNFWLSQESKNPNFSWFMIRMIWFFWIINQFLNLIILLNFLIALISEKYNEITSENIVHAYNHKAALNQECRLVFQQLGILVPPIDYLIVQHESEEKQGQQQQWQNFLNQIKAFVHKSVKKVIQKEELSDKWQETIQGQIEIHKRKLNKAEGSIASKIDRMEENMKKKIDDVHKQMDTNVHSLYGAIDDLKTQMGADIEQIKSLITSLNGS